MTKATKTTKATNTAQQKKMLAKATAAAWQAYTQAESTAKEKYINLLIAMVNESKVFDSVKAYIDSFAKTYGLHKSIKNEYFTLVKYLLMLSSDAAIRLCLTENNKRTVLYMARHKGQKPTEKEESTRKARQTKTTDTDTDTDTDTATPLVDGAGLASAPALLNNKNIEASLLIYYKRLQSLESLQNFEKILINNLERVQADIKKKKAA